MRYLLVRKKDNLIISALEVEGFTESYIEHENGEKFPTKIVNGKTILTQDYLVPTGHGLIASDTQAPGNVYDPEFNEKRRLQLLELENKIRAERELTTNGA